MPKQKNSVQTVRITISTSEEIASYLDDLADVGIQGKTRTETAERLVGEGIRRLISEGLLKQRSKAT